MKYSCRQRTWQNDRDGAEVIDVTQNVNAEAAVNRAAALVRQGQIVAVPTETVYGLLANADMPEAVELLHRVKGRREGRPYTYLIADITVLEADGAEVSAAAERLIQRFWPGPLTLVLPVGEGWRGYRLPDHDFARQIIRAARCRVFAPSANKSGSAEPTTAQDVMRELGEEIPLILDGGPCRIGRFSTVVRVRGEVVEILREGAIPGKIIEAVARGDT